MELGKLPIVEPGFTYQTRGVFLGYETRGVIVRQEGASGSCNVTPEKTLQGGIEIGNKILMTWQHRFQESKRSQMGQYAASIRSVCVEISLDKSTPASPAK